MLRRALAGDIVAALVLASGAAVILQQSTTWPAAADVAGNPVVFPRMVAAIMLAVAALLVGLKLPAPDPDEAGAEGARRIALAFLVTAALAAGLDTIGLVPGGFLYVLAMQRIAGAPLRLAAPFAIAAPIVIWLAFATALKVPLPWGRLMPALGW
ncbi:MAG: tripartite tricarboxylate transporter TctB family protein [Methylobacteriaceae bacterium]|nr:tripartite tricarboxylate transporter TctB family protein [Methylobacteriaceae bacterium]